MVSSIFMMVLLSGIPVPPGRCDRAVRGAVADGFPWDADVNRAILLHDFLANHGKELQHCAAFR